MAAQKPSGHRADLCHSKRYVPVPYVVSHPAWLVARKLPALDALTAKQDAMGVLELIERVGLP